jgi:cell division initiation protein
MKITPLEIRQKTFEKKSFGGYDKDEVQAYLISLSQAWERLLDENKEMRIRLETADREVQKLREVESSLFKTLKTAEDTGANLIDQASKTAALNLREAQIKAESLIKDAKWQAKNIIEDAERQAKGIEIEYKTIENARDNFLAELRNLANDLLEKAERTQHKAQQSHYSASPRPDLETFKAQIREVAEPTPTPTPIPVVEETVYVAPPQPISEPVAVVEEPKIVIPTPEPPTNTTDSGSFFDQIG